MESAILANAELVRKVASEQIGVTVNYDEAGVRWLNTYINGQHLAANEELKKKLVHTLGSFLGECIRQTYGGQWASEPDSQFWFISFSESNTVYPFNKVRKQLQDGPDESVLGFFKSIAALFPQQGRGESVGVSAAKPWWKFW